jgi:hypothetical protein
MDILNSLRRGNDIEKPYDSERSSTMAMSNKPLTISEIIDGQIKYHESKIADLKAAKDAVSPDVEKALNALARL